MYEIDDKDRIVALDAIPKPDAGAPMPMVVANERRLIVSYLVQGPPTKWDPVELEVSRFEDETATVSFDMLSFKFGYPNDEAMFGHPLYERGLRSYGAWEVLDSSWTRRLERMNRAHDMHNPAIFHSYHHFILTFHDTMLECIANGFNVERHKEAPSEAMRRNMDWLLGQT